MMLPDHGMSRKRPGGAAFRTARERLPCLSGELAPLYVRPCRERDSGVLAMRMAAKIVRTIDINAGRVSTSEEVLKKIPYRLRLRSRIRLSPEPKELLVPLPRHLLRLCGLWRHTVVYNSLVEK